MTNALFIAGTPKGQPRPKAYRRGAHAAVYDPGTAAEWKFLIARAFEGVELPDGPLCVSLKFQMPRPKSHYRTGKHAGKLKDSAPYWHTKKPDLDNLIKAVLDAMPLGDDARVARMAPGKAYVPANREPGVFVDWVAL